MAREPRDWSAEAARTADVREDALIRRDYSTSLMSNAKWRKLIEAVSELDELELTCIVKFVGAPEERTMRIPQADDLRGLSYLDSQFGPFRLKAIEWLEVPRTVTRSRYGGDPGLDVRRMSRR